MTTRRAIFTTAGIFLVFILLVYIKVTVLALSEYEKAETALRTGTVNEAITHLNRAIHWYSPGSTSVRMAIDRLWEIGQSAEQKNNHETALHAYRMLRSSLYSARSFYTPHPDWIARCDERIAAIVSQQPPEPSLSGHPYPSPKKEEVLEVLKTRTEPDYFWSIICEGGFVGWIACTIAFIFFVFSGERGFRTRRAYLWGGLLVAFYALWVLGMLKA